MIRNLIAALALMLAAAPVAAQLAPPPPVAPPEAAMGRGSRAFATMSEPGRRAVVEAMRPGGDADRADLGRVRSARDRMLALLDTERLDTVALRRAMDDERDAAGAMKQRRQAAILQAFQGLSAADRRAFVADARGMRGRFESRHDRFKQRTHGRGGMGGPL